MSKDLKGLYLLQKKELIKILNDWDPYKLVSEGAPEDELEPEATLILAQLGKLHTVEEISKLVSNTFIGQFDNPYDSKDCHSVAIKILDFWKDKKWITEN